MDNEGDGTMKGKIKKHFGGAAARSAALCLTLCFVLVTAFSGAAWAEGALSGLGLGFAPDIPCKKSEIPYFDRLDRTQVYQVEDKSYGIYSAVLDKYPDSGSVTDLVCHQHPAGLSGAWYWLGLCGRVDAYLRELPPLERAVAWHGLCNVLEPLARGYEATVRQTRELVERVARQRLQNQPPADSPDFSGADLQSIADGYRDLELAFAAVAQKLRVEQAKNLARLPQDIRQALEQSYLIGTGPASRLDISASEAAFLTQTRQERLDIGESMDDIMYDIGVAFDSAFSVALRVYFNQEDKDYLFLAETCTHAAVAQFAADRRLPGELGMIIDKAIKGTIPEYLAEFLNDFEIAVEVGDAPSPEIRRDKQYLPYHWREVKITHRSRDLVRELKDYIDTYTGK